MPFSPGKPRPFVVRQCLAFLLALGFLTRLAPPLRTDDAAMAAAVRFYPLAGAALGLLLIAPFACGLFAGRPTLQAWIYVALNAWATRALHLDGLADVLDAAGSGKNGDAFRAVLKDSRVGAFGVTGLIIALSGQLIFACGLFSGGALAPLLFAPLYGRSLPILLASLSAPHSREGLGALMEKGKGMPALLLAAACAGLGGLAALSPVTLLVCLLLTLPPLLFLIKLACKQGGYNGDFFGFLIISGELAALAAALLSL